ncbi:S-adenosyl-L-methionine-dependent methyltransferase [Truncatella angustata]|uniref:S-adenosyl-L-methionine-dependent methyltransferase n=1 Tax=Truncatella angustata TaxID=152316 RepID=A0A9P8UQ99_9PEZI|nr:S-adenosyl-L-methionine-dependent methyltransferase [Truncatella angustata]KAH6656244.1 S-adenosyl-L-methionine-dependent methyltransferase [Truncatella angustata]
MTAVRTSINGFHEAELVDISVLRSPANLGAILPTLKSLNAGLPSLTIDSDDARFVMLQAAWKLVLSLETPRETMLRHCWSQSGAVAALNTGSVSGLWQTMAKNGDRPQKVGELAAATGVDEVLLARIMRHLSAIQYLEETGPNEYKTTSFTKAMAHELMADSHIAMCSGTSAGAYQFHEFARDNKFHNPVDAHNTSMMQAYKTNKDMFQWLQQIGYGEQFNNHMRAYAQGRLRWMDPLVFPVEERLIEGAETAFDAPFIVDIAGGVGHDLVHFKTNYPGHPGKLILQDLPKVIGQIKELDTSIVRMEYDFHTPQPTKAARAYFMHSTLHDWPDDVCGSILKNTVEAMKPGYSKLLINENVIPKSKAHWEMTSLDMVMLTLFNSRERTEEDWTDLLAANGLKIVKIWQGGKAWESLIECELA